MLARDICCRRIVVVVRSSSATQRSVTAAARQLCVSALIVEMLLVEKLTDASALLTRICRLREPAKLLCSAVACDAFVDGLVLGHEGAGAAARKVDYRARHFGTVVISSHFFRLVTLAMRQKFIRNRRLGPSKPQIFSGGRAGRAASLRSAPLRESHFQKSRIILLSISIESHQPNPIDPLTHACPATRERRRFCHHSYLRFRAPSRRGAPPLAQGRLGSTWRNDAM